MSLYGKVLYAIETILMGKFLRNKSNKIRLQKYRKFWKKMQQIVMESI